MFTHTDKSSILNYIFQYKNVWNNAVSCLFSWLIVSTVNCPILRNTATLLRLALWSIEFVKLRRNLRLSEIEFTTLCSGLQSILIYSVKNVWTCMRTINSKPSHWSIERNHSCWIKYVFRNEQYSTQHIFLKWLETTKFSFRTRDVTFCWYGISGS